MPRYPRPQAVHRQPSEAESLYFDYLDALYRRYKLAGRLAVLAELVPLLETSDRDTLAHLMSAAGYGWRGLTKGPDPRLVEGLAELLTPPAKAAESEAAGDGSHTG